MSPRNDAKSPLCKKVDLPTTKPAKMNCTKLEQLSIEKWWRMRRHGKREWTQKFSGREITTPTLKTKITKQPKVFMFQARMSWNHFCFFALPCQCNAANGCGHGTNRLHSTAWVRVFTSCIMQLQSRIEPSGFTKSLAWWKQDFYRSFLIVKDEVYK